MNTEVLKQRLLNNLFSYKQESVCEIIKAFDVDVLFDLHQKTDNPRLNSKIV